MSMDKPIVRSSTEGTRGPEVKNAKMRSPGLGNRNMNMSVDKPKALSSTESTRSPSEKCKNEVSRAWELEYEHVHGQTDSAE